MARRTDPAPYPARAAPTEHGRKRIYNRSHEPLRRVVAVQCGADVRLFRRRRPAHRIRLVGIDRGRRRLEPCRTPRRHRRRPHGRAANHAVRPPRALPIYNPPHAARGQRNRRDQALRDRGEDLLCRTPPAHRKAGDQPMVGRLGRNAGRFEKIGSRPTRKPI